ncbi:MAG: signal recognition particle receptor subunit alpha [Candidatus Kariarchaeaceae archaeon]
MVLSGLGKSLSGAMNRLLSRGPVDKETILELKNEIFKSLLEADVQMDIAYQMAENMQNRALNEEIPVGVSRKDAMVTIIYEELARIMGWTSYPLQLEKNRVNILMTIGIQGSGKTTTIGKLSKLLKQDGWNIGLVCTDTWRPGAYDQLSQLGSKVGVEVFGDPNSKDAVKLATTGIDKFTKDGKNLIIVDTAGRHKEEKDLLKEMVTLNKKIKPHEIILVIDGTLGQSAFNQAKAFAETTDIGSIIVTKLDGTAKGGGAISAAAATQAPIKFVGMGEDITEFEKFNPKGFAGRILGIGDLEGLLDQVQSAQITPDEERAKAMMKGNITYDDMMDMFQQMNKFGGLRKLLDKLPGGLSHSLDDDMLSMSKDSMEQYQNIILSMTKKERMAEVKLGKTRVDRIAMGSGVDTEKVKELVKQKKMAEKWIKQMMKGGGKRRGGKGNSGFPFNLAGMMG